MIGTVLTILAAKARRNTSNVDTFRNPTLPHLNINIRCIEESGRTCLPQVPPQQIKIWRTQVKANFGDLDITVNKACSGLPPGEVNILESQIRHRDLVIGFSNNLKGLGSWQLDNRSGVYDLYRNMFTINICKIPSKKT